MTATEWVTFVGLLAGTLISLQVVFNRFIWRPVRKALLSEFEAELDARLAPILRLVSQLETNGGSHLADRIIRLEERQTSVVTRLDDLFDLIKTMKESK